MKYIFFCLLLWINCCNASSAQDMYTFPTSQQQTQFASLTQQLRCLVCQNETLADSNAPLAQDLRNDIAQMILQRDSNQEIINYLVNRYGSYVLYQPRLAPNTILLWFGPLLLLSIGIAIAGFIIWQRQKRARQLR
jgi:cytochrome c-type biogenesis protein CcmH